MKRAVLAVVSTIAGLIALLGYRVPAPPADMATSEASDVELAIGETVEEVTTTTTELPISTTTTTPAISSSGPTVRTRATTTTTQPTTTTTIPNVVRTGPLVTSKYGAFQVRATLKGSKIVSVRTIKYPQETAVSAQLNKEAVTKLEAEAMKAQSADIETISGATEASEAFIKSLEGALDA